ncbi:DUF803-domain-containing protein [Aulographum hederae CBS 113979]|uniref:DUF803-domain-containing protein n=1 Tax=Aulographum hederae CBS 113979 TaxID=1176131 RepID=A0A6G1GRY5_9PEZI|nr:DUF803-domain-containing protein [Aulographum hederae CBS 113979]
MDSAAYTAGSHLLATNELYIRSGGSTGDAPRPAYYKVVGLVLAIVSGLFIGVSFVLKKHGLLKANQKYNEEAGEGYGYLKNFWWWCGMTLMILGELCNFAAYLFVDAILVAPLGALSVVVCTILSAIFLKERLSFVGKVGCFQCIVGSVIIALNVPTQSGIDDINELRHMVAQPGFATWGSLVVAICLFVAFYLGPKYGKKSMFVYITVCSLIGGLSVVAVQGLGIGIMAQTRGIPQFNQWFLYVVLVFVIITLVTEIIYLNKALNLYNAALVTPTYYVYFTSATIVTSAILFQGFKGTVVQIVTVVLGFLTICSGVVLLQLSKSAKDVPDAAVFTGDLDQVRTVAEQEEPEYEPRADTIRGGGALLRSISRQRTKKEMASVKKLQEEHMEPLQENESVEWDGLRRRKTVLGSQSSSIRRSKTLHPPLGMSRFPDSDEESNPDDLHPGLFTFRRNRSNVKTPNSASASVPMSPIRPTTNSTAATFDPTRDHVYGLPPGLQPAEIHEETEYKPHQRPTSASQHIHFADETPAAETRAKSPNSAGAGGLAPRPPPHMAKRQFSFQNVFHRSRASSHGNKGSSSRPTSSRGFGALRHNSGGSAGNNNDPSTTEEERLGLVRGDSNQLLSSAEYASPSTPPDYADVEDEWTVAAAAAGRGVVSPREGALEGGFEHGRGASIGSGGSISVVREEEESEGGNGNGGGGFGGRTGWRGSGGGVGAGAGPLGSFGFERVEEASREGSEERELGEKEGYGMGKEYEGSGYGYGNRRRDGSGGTGGTGGGGAFI